jgi:hypothetical protein
MTSENANPAGCDDGDHGTLVDDSQSSKVNRQDPQVTSHVEAIALARINDCGAQMRVEMRVETVNDYAADMLDGATFPAVILFDDGAELWVADGYHRVAAARKIEREAILAEIRQGSARDAILYSVGSNAVHGLRRTQADKRRAVERLLRDPEWAAWSDRQIAKAARVDHKTVGTIRRELIAGGKPNGGGKGGDFPGSKVGEAKAACLLTSRASLTADVLRTIPDDVLIAECRRRGLMGANDV